MRKGAWSPSRQLKGICIRHPTPHQPVMWARNKL
jgi:hypothetical protein